MTDTHVSSNIDNALKSIQEASSILKNLSIAIKILENRKASKDGWDVVKNSKALAISGLQAASSHIDIATALINKK